MKILSKIMIMAIVSLLTIGMGSLAIAASLDVALGNSEQEKTLIGQTNTALEANNWQDASNILTQLITMDPFHWQYFMAFGDVKSKLGLSQEATNAYEKAISLAQQDANGTRIKTKSEMNHIFLFEGNMYLKLHKTDEAVTAYTKAAEFSENPSFEYFNICAVFYNTGNFKQSLVFADKTIALDPNKADAYFIKGSILFVNCKTDEKGNYIASPGTIEALKKYLELAPNGPHAEDVRAMLEMLGVH